MPKVAAPPPTAAPGVAMPAPAAPTGAPPGIPPPRLASSNPDTMVSTGLASNFNGRVHSLFLLPRKVTAGKKVNTYGLYCELNILADDTSLGKDGLVTEYMNVSSLNQWVPSAVDPVWNPARNDYDYIPAGNGATLDLYMALHEGKAGFPVPGSTETAILPPADWKGFFAIPGKQNSMTGFGKGTKYEQFTQALKTLKYHERAPHINWDDFRQFLLGVYGHWTRIPFEFKGGQPPPDAGADQKQRTIDTLCMTEILDLGPISGNGAGGARVQVAVPAMPAAAAPVSAPAAAAPTTPAAARRDPAAIAAAINEILTALVAQAGATGVSKNDIGAAVFEQVNARGLDGASALMLINDASWLEGDDRTFGYRAVDGRLLPLG